MEYSGYVVVLVQTTEPIFNFFLFSYTNFQNNLVAYKSEIQKKKFKHFNIIKDITFYDLL